MYIVAEVTELNEYKSKGGIRAMSKRLRNTVLMVGEIASTVMIGMALLTAIVVSLGWPMIGKQLTTYYDGYSVISSTANLNTIKSADEEYREEVATIMQQAGFTNSETKHEATIRLFCDSPTWVRKRYIEGLRLVVEQAKAGHIDNVAEHINIHTITFQLVSCQA